MKFTAAATALLSAAFVSAQQVNLSALPKCSHICLQTAIQQSGCGGVDYQCQCGPQKETITTLVTPCIIRSCSEEDALSTSYPASFPDHWSLTL
ncbi:hypothetical protein P152DRAFT_455817 [Eremomyces bilateralis CBS 781.70]|uniref:CFEM domain-containing protein n=1 Tax=Eremomyces bilateralis CBS 781.70 TaxID=1392243 RepID=A0A6G1G9M8_9PEZI|nr:uncharacterized protein P152DRAFT_455817 [Eremomyces bilateralis CBS 781.70]KAF1814787.1 hypothetical protein P152DRAFT_455817 [Eremomyces bilateralis CBS 781.70]